MADAIRSYMDAEITAFALDDALTRCSRATSDKTVQILAQALWFHYDDFKDHKIIASKQEWDYFHRLLLLLQSDGEIEATRSWRQWHPLHGVAGTLLLLFVATTCEEGFGEHLVGFALPFGPPSMLIAWLNWRREQRKISSDEISSTPFPTFGSLLAVRRRVAGFTKRPYPMAIAGRRIRDPIFEKLLWIPLSMAWCMFAPVVLFFQMLPGRVYKTRITIPEPHMESPISPWSDKAVLISPDGRYRAVIQDAAEIAMGAPTSGTLVISENSEGGPVVSRHMSCNSSFVWSSDSSSIAAPQWTPIRLQRLIIISVPSGQITADAVEYSVLELHSFENGVVRGVDSPAYMPRQIEIVAREPFPGTSTQKR